MKTRNWLVIFPIILFFLVGLVACGSTSSGSEDPQEIETMLTELEKDKVDKFFAGNFSETQPLFTDDFINVAFNPTGTVRQNKEESAAALAGLPPFDGEYDVTDFQFVHSDDQTVIVSYKTTAPFGSYYATSIWALRDGEWKTVFYQDTPIFP